MPDHPLAAVESIVDAALDVSEPERAALVDRLAGGNEAVRDAALAWLRGIARDPHLLDGGVQPLLGPLQLEHLLEELPAPGAHVGPWQVVRELGRGGMGVVYLVERTDTELPMRAALKRMRDGGALDAVGRRRFREERRLLARLEHPGIARLVDGGVSPDGSPWFAMEFVDGIPIDQWCRERALGVRERVRLMVRVCDAVQHAHARLVVHRDIKPSNVLVGADGVPRLLDFGIAKLLEPGDHTDPDLTRPGAAPLSLPFAAPEQLREEPISTATDVYALGVLLHLLLTGTLPFGDGRDGRLALEARMRDGATTRPSTRLRDDTAAATGLGASTLRKALRGDLETVVLHAMQPEAARRYPSAAALGDDLRAWLDNRPVIARPDSVSYRLRKVVARNPFASAAVTVSVVALLVFSLVTAQQARRIAFERENAEAVATFLGETLAQVNVHTRGREPPTLRDVLDAGATRAETMLDARPEVRGLLLATIAPAFHSLGEWDRERALLVEAERAQREAFGPDDVRRAVVLQQLAQLEMQIGTAEQAESHARESLRLIERHGAYNGLEAEHLRLLLAATLFRQGRSAAVDSLNATRATAP